MGDGYNWDEYYARMRDLYGARSSAPTSNGNAPPLSGNLHANATAAEAAAREEANEQLLAQILAEKAEDFLDEFNDAFDANTNDLFVDPTHSGWTPDMPFNLNFELGRNARMARARGAHDRARRFQAPVSSDEPFFARALVNPYHKRFSTTPELFFSDRIERQNTKTFFDGPVRFSAEDPRSLQQQLDDMLSRMRGPPHIAEHLRQAINRRNSDIDTGDDAYRHIRDLRHLFSPE